MDANHKIIIFCMLLMGMVKISLAQTTTTLQYYGEFTNSSYLLSMYDFWNSIGVVNSAWVSIPILCFIGVLYAMMWQKMGMLVPTILLLIFTLAYPFVALPFNAAWFIFVSVAIIIAVGFYKTLT